MFMYNICISLLANCIDYGRSMSMELTFVLVWCSFVHDLLEVDDKAVEKGTVSSDELLKSKSGDTVWNAKVDSIFERIIYFARHELCKLG